MDSFSVITKNCVETVYTERKKQCVSRIEKLKVTCAEQWTLLKLNLYYNYLRFRSWFTTFV